MELASCGNCGRALIGCRSTPAKAPYPKPRHAVFYKLLVIPIVSLVHLQSQALAATLAPTITRILATPAIGV